VERFLTRRTQIAVVGRSTARLAASHRSVAVEMRGRHVNRRCINQERRGSVRLNHVRCGDRSNGHWHGDLRIRRAFHRCVAGEVRLENRIDACVCDCRNRGCKLGGLEGRETRLDKRIGERRWGLDGLVNVRLRLWVEVNADETIALRALGKHGRGLTP
jgi:hypothetical protein